MSDEFILSTIPLDFSVELLGRQDNNALFGEVRKDVWHFVLCEWPGADSEIDHFHNANISQIHIPRFVVATAVESLLHKMKANTALLRKTVSGSDPLNVAPIKVDLWGDWIIGIRADLVFEIGPKEHSLSDMALPAGFAEKLCQDLPLLRQSKGKVKAKEGYFILPRSKTYHGNPVSSEFRRLIEAIAFEKALHGKLDAHRFGIYSAFCTLRDFPLSQEMTSTCLHDLVLGQFQYDPESLPEFALDIFDGVQHKLLSSPIWGIHVKVSLDQAVAILAEGMAKLSQAQRTQFILMNGMHKAGLFLPLAAVTGQITFEEYAGLKTYELAPDSGEEQQLRIETAHIELLGWCARGEDLSG